MKKRILCFALAAMMACGNVGASMTAFAAGNTTITAEKNKNDPYTGREYLAAENANVAEDISLPDSWSWANPKQALSNDFTDAVVVQKSGETEVNRVTVKIKRSGNGRLTQEVNVADGLPAVAVDGMTELLKTDSGVVSEEEIKKVDNGEIDINVKLVVQSADAASSEAQAIAKLAGEKGLTISTFLDLSLYKITRQLLGQNAGTESVENVGGTNRRVLEIAVPYDTSKARIVVFRCHDGKTAALTKKTSRPTSDFKDGSYYVGDGCIYIYASGFSVYAIGESDTAETVRHSSSGGSSGGGSSVMDVRAVNVESTAAGPTAETSSAAAAESAGTAAAETGAAVESPEKGTADMAVGTETGDSEATDHVSNAAKPNTGDESCMLLYGMLFMCSAGAMVGYARVRRKRQ